MVTDTPCQSDAKETTESFQFILNLTPLHGVRVRKKKRETKNEEEKDGSRNLDPQKICRVGYAFRIDVAEDALPLLHTSPASIHVHPRRAHERRNLRDGSE